MDGRLEGYVSMNPTYAPQKLEKAPHSIERGAFAVSNERLRKFTGPGER